MFRTSVQEMGHVLNLEAYTATKSYIDRGAQIYNQPKGATTPVLQRQTWKRGQARNDFCPERTPRLGGPGCANGLIPKHDASNCVPASSPTTTFVQSSALYRDGIGHISKIHTPKWNLHCQST